MLELIHTRRTLSGTKLQAGQDSPSLSRNAALITLLVIVLSLIWISRIATAQAIDPLNAPALRAIAITSGKTHTCALTITGGVQCWGGNAAGEVGDNTTINRTVRTDVMGLGSGVLAISAGLNHTCALLNTGAVKCWGLNSSGQLGDGTYIDRLVPVDVVGLGANVTAIAAGGDHTCARIGTNILKCWGGNSYGEVGDGTTSNQNRPIDVQSLTGEIKMLALGGNHTCTLIDSSLKCWGYNAFGQLGDGTTSTRTTPVDVLNLGGLVISLSAGSNHTCLVTDFGAAKCWGANYAVQIGDGTTTQRTSPRDVVDLSSGVKSILASWEHTCALLENASVRCWGRNDAGQLGNDSAANRATPVNVLRLDAAAVALAAGENHTCALMLDGGIRCWGGNNLGQHGDSRNVSQSSPVEVIGINRDVKMISAGGYHTCILTLGGIVTCWGRNNFGQLGDGTYDGRIDPTDVIQLPERIMMIAAGGNHTCALTATGGVKCWGYNGFGQLGDNTTENRTTPVQVSGLISGVITISAGRSHTCALLFDGSAKCWGLNGFGRLGDGTTTNRPIPAAVTGLANGVTALTAGGNHSCAQVGSIIVRCWGSNSAGQLGNGTTSLSTVPIDVIHSQTGLRTISVGWDHSCFVATDGSAHCWGENSTGQLGDNTTERRTQPVAVFGLSSGVIEISAGRHHSCARMETGAIKCWGENSSGQLGDGTLIQRLLPVDVDGMNSNNTSVAAGWFHTCGLLSSGMVKCWGYNDFGQLGTTPDWLPGDALGFGEVPGPVTVTPSPTTTPAAITPVATPTPTSTETATPTSTGTATETTNAPTSTLTNVPTGNQTPVTLTPTSLSTNTPTVTSVPATPDPRRFCMIWTTSLTVGEGQRIQYDARLCSAPLAPVTVTLFLLDNAAQQITVTTTSQQPFLYFDQSNWNQEQTVIISAVDDNVSEPYQQLVQIGHPMTSLDSNYQRLGKDEALLDVTVLDNDFRSYLPAVIKQELPPARWQTFSSTPENLDTLVLNGTQLFVGERTELSMVQGIYRSATCGVASTFERLMPDVPIYDLAFDGANGLAATKGGKVYSSNNGGQSWTRTNSTVDGHSMRVYAVTFTSGKRAYAGADDGLYLSEDNGVTWSKVVATNGSGPVLLNELYFDSVSNLLWIATYGNGVWKLTPGGTTFTQLVDGLAGVNSDRRVWDITTSGGTVYLATANGVYKGNGSNAWIADGLQGVQVLTFERVGATLYAGTGSQTSGTGLWLRPLIGAQPWQRDGSLPATLTVRDLHFDGIGSCGIGASGQKSLFAATNDGVWVYR